MVYTLDRFSRTGGGAIKLAQDLREKYGVTVFAVTQPTDTSNPSGVLHQNIQLLFSEFDNQLRKQRAIAGMKEKFEKGEWVTRVPQGYDIVKINGVRKIVINKEGKLIKKAFEWKGEGMKNEEIIKRLNTQGMKMYKQQLVKIFKKPFYCGIINHGLLNGKVIEGNHPKLISQELFLKVNNLNISSHQYGVPHKKEREQVPLKVFMKCEDCGQPFAGYIVKKKNLWYYKCRIKGCKCNRSTKEMNKAFVEYLERFMPDEKSLTPLQFEFEQLYYKINEEKFEKEKRLKEQLIEVNKKMDTIEEKFYVLNEMSKEAFDKFYPKYQKEREEIQEQLTFHSFDIGFYNRFVKYLTYDAPLLNRAKLTKGLRVNTIGKIIKNLKSFLKDRISRRLIPHMDLSFIKSMEEEVDAVYLNWNELSKIYHLDLSLHPYLIKYRDVFMVGCLTGLRFGDYSNIQFDEVRNDMLHVVQRKTLSTVIIPLREDAKKILIDKYNISMPKVSLVKFNLYIKKVVRLAGIKEPIKITHRKGNTMTSEVKPKYAWVSSHTARRSFCTNEYLAGTPTDLIMAISGHKTEKMFRRYIKADKMQKAEMIKKIWDNKPCL